MRKNALTISSLTDEHIYQITKGMTQADYAARYWKCQLQHYNDLDTTIRYILLCTSGTGAIASWAVWQSAPWAWQILSGLSTLLAGYHTVVNHKQHVETLIKVHDKCILAHNQYQRLWMLRDSLPAGEVLEKLDEIHKIEAVIAHDTQKFKHIEYYESVCQREVFTENGWEIPAELNKDRRTLSLKLMGRKHNV